MADILRLNLKAYPGGVAVWGALNPVYDTTSTPVEMGVHVSANSKSQPIYPKSERLFHMIEGHARPGRPPRHSGSVQAHILNPICPHDSDT